VRFLQLCLDRDLFFFLLSVDKTYVVNDIFVSFLGFVQRLLSDRNYLCYNQINTEFSFTWLQYLILYKIKD